MASPSDIAVESAAEVARGHGEHLRDGGFREGFWLSTSL